MYRARAKSRASTNGYIKLKQAAESKPCSEKRRRRRTRRRKRRRKRTLLFFFLN